MAMAGFEVPASLQLHMLQQRYSSSSQSWQTMGNGIPTTGGDPAVPANGHAGGGTEFVSQRRNQSAVGVPDEGNSGQQQILQQQHLQLRHSPATFPFPQSEPLMRGQGEARYPGAQWIGAQSASGVAGGEWPRDNLINPGLRPITTPYGDARPRSVSEHPSLSPPLALHNASGGSSGSGGSPCVPSLGNWHVSKGADQRHPNKAGEGVTHEGRGGGCRYSSMDAVAAATGRGRPHSWSGAATSGGGGSSGGGSPQQGREYHLNTGIVEANNQYSTFPMQHLPANHSTLAPYPAFLMDPSQSILPFKLTGEQDSSMLLSRPHSLSPHVPGMPPLPRQALHARTHGSVPAYGPLLGRQTSPSILSDSSQGMYPCMSVQSRPLSLHTDVSHLPGAWSGAMDINLPNLQDTLGAPIKHDWASAPSLVVHIKAPEALLLGTTRGATPSAVGQSSPRLNNSGLEKFLGRDVSHPCLKRMPDISTSSPDSDDGENSSLPGSESKNEGIPERAGGRPRERSKLSKAHCAEVDDLKQRSMKRKEANRESAARSRDRRLKLISDLETEVRQLKRKLAYYKDNAGTAMSAPHTGVLATDSHQRSPLYIPSTDESANPDT